MLSSKVDTEQEAGLQSSDTVTTGRMPVMNNRAETLTNGRMPVVSNRAETLTNGRMPVVSNRAETLTTTGRMPVVIPGAGKRIPQKIDRSPVKTKHRMWLNGSVVLVLGIFVLTTILTVLPLGKDGQALGVNGLFQRLGVMNLISSNSQNSALVGPEAATATAIMAQDGYSPPAPVAQQFNASLGINGTGDNFPYGQCTYWADYRYHQLTGFWVPWSGNAYQWAYNAPAAGWVVSSTPRVPSIMVLQPGVQYANTAYGHVGIVEAINPDGSLSTSNMNIYGYAFGSVVYQTNYVGAGVSFIYRP